MLDPTVPAKLRFRLLGEATLAAANSEPFRLSTQKGMALLAYLAMSRGRAITRSVLADLLWSDRTESQARQNLRQTLLSLRRDLGTAIARALLADDQSLMLRAEALDVDALSFAAVASAPDLASRARCLDQPWGAFLHNFSTGSDVFDQWVLSERQRLDAIAIRAFAELAERFDAAGDGERAILALEQLVTVDPSEQERHRRLISLEARYRGPDAALARAKSLTALLAHELDDKPERATLALVEEIRATAATRLDMRPIAVAARAHGDIAPAPEAAAPAIRRNGSPWRRRNAAIAAGALALILIGIGFGWIYINQPRVASNEAASRSAALGDSLQPPAVQALPPMTNGRAKGIVALAVIPFTSYGESGEAARFANMMTDDLTNVLGRAPGFRVISLSTVKTYRDQNIDAATVGAKLDVAYVIEGRVSMRDNHLRVSVELTNTETRLQAWSGRFDLADGDPESIQQEIVKSIGRELNVQIGNLESKRQGQAPVHQLVIKGWQAIADFPTSGLEALRRAERFFTEAREQDPNASRAAVGLAAFHTFMVVYGSEPDPLPRLGQAQELLETWIARRPNIPGARHYLATVQRMRGQWQEAAATLRQELAINPSFAPSYASLGYTLVRLGQVDEGRERIRYAMRLSPKDYLIPQWLTFAGAAELELGHADKAIEHLEHARAASPHYPPTLLTLAAAHAIAGNLAEARRCFDELQKLRPQFSAAALIERYGDAHGAPAPNFRHGLDLALAALP
jgi:DNA-binding SARP family transcriptional activator/TolB-like protein